MDLVTNSIVITEAIKFVEQQSKEELMTKMMIKGLKNLTIIAIKNLNTSKERNQEKQATINQIL
jgi:hypothetical protein